MTPSLPFDLLLITDGQRGSDIVRKVREVLIGDVPSGRVALQLRAKHLPEAEFLETAKALRELTTRAYVPFMVNGPLEVAKAARADGIQLPESGPSAEDARAALGDKAMIGRSCHDEAGLVEAQSTATFATLSPYFAVPGKGAPLAFSEASRLCATSPLPVIALGGIGPGQVSEALSTGACGIAVIRAVFAASDPYDAMLDMLAALDRVRFSR